MAPKKKSGKKQADDWESELGETPDPIAAATAAAKAAEDQQDADVNGAVDGEDAEGGGLLAALKKNKAKRAKKGKVVDDFVEGEDPPAAQDVVGTINLEGKTPEEATFDDEDVSATSGKKGRAGKKQPEKLAEEEAEVEDDDDDAGGMKSKKEKEKERKEREKQRKKEQVCGSGHIVFTCDFDLFS